MLRCTIYALMILKILGYPIRCQHRKGWILAIMRLILPSSWSGTPLKIGK